MALNGRAVRQGNTTNFGVGQPGAFPRACADVNGTLYVVVGDGLIEITNLAAGSGTHVSFGLSGTDWGGAFGFGNDLYATTSNPSRTLRRVTNFSTGATTHVANLNPNIGACATDGTRVWAFDRGDNKLFEFNTTNWALTEIEDVAFASGVSEGGVQGMVYWNGRLYIVGGHTDKLYILDDLATNPDPINAVVVDNSVTEFGAGEQGPAGMTVHDGEVYMIGGSTDALFRLINPPSVPDTLTRLEADEGVETEFDLTATITDLERLTLQTGWTPPTYFSIDADTETDIVIADTADVAQDTDFDAELTAHRGLDSVNFDQPMRIRNVGAMMPDTMPAFADDASIAEITATRDSAITTVTLPAATGGNGALVYSISPNLPTGVDFNATTRQLSGTPTALLTRTEFTYTVTDEDGDTDTLTFHLTVAAPDLMPAFAADASIAEIVATQNVAITAVTLPAASGGDGALTYSLSPNLPAGLSFNTTTRRFSGTPTAVLSRTQFTYTVTDEDGDTDTLQFYLTVNAPAPVDLMPAFADDASIAEIVATQNVAITPITLPAATGGDTPLAYSLSPSPPAGLSFNANTRRFSGTPTAVSARTQYTYTVTDNDGDTDTIQFYLTVNAPAPRQDPMPPPLSSAPPDLQVTFPTATTALITWKAPTNGALLTGYEISYAEGASPGTTWIPTERLSTRFVVKGLKRSMQYTWQVRGVTENGAGDASSPITMRTPIASLHNALFFKECVNYLDDGARISEHGNPSNIIRAVADNDYRTFTREKDLVLNIARNGNPTRVDAVFVKGIGIERHSAAPTGGTGSGYRNRRMPATVKNWEGTDVSTIVNGFQHDLYLLDGHFTATSVRLTFTGTDAMIYEVMLLEFGLEIDANSDFTQIDLDFVDREGVIHSDPGGGIVYDSPIGDERDKWEITYTARVVPGKTILETPEEFLYWRAENRNHVFCMEPSRFPWRIFPAVFVGKRVPVRYRTDSKTSGEVLSFRVSEQ